jgi:hypothetical protein
VTRRPLDDPPNPAWDTSNRTSHGIHVNIVLEEHKLCLLIMTGVRADDSEELVALAGGDRESPGRTCCAMSRGGTIAPILSWSGTAHCGLGR